MKFRSILPLFLFMVLGAVANAAGKDIYFNSKDGTQLHGIVYEAAQPRALLLVAHGLQSHAGWFLSGEELAKNGITVLAYDRRGSGLSGGARGHVDDRSEFFDDMRASAKELRAYGKNLPMHLHANCFATRIAVPFTVNFPGVFRSVIFTSPSTNMSAEADYSAAERSCLMKMSLGIASSSCKSMIIGRDQFAGDYIRTPLRDELFTTNQDWLAGFVQADPLALRAVSVKFLTEAAELTSMMDEAIRSTAQGLPAFSTPMLLVLAKNDRMVDNKGIKVGLWRNLVADKKLVELNCEHGLEFCGDQQVGVYRQEMVNWILTH